MDLGCNADPDQVRQATSLSQFGETPAPDGPRCSENDPETERVVSFMKRPSKGRILIVDDDPSVRETLADLLEMVGYYTMQAADASEALTVLRQASRVDVLVTDLTMPGADGITLIHDAQELKQGLPAILLTTAAEQVPAGAATAFCRFHMLRKPVESQQLIEQLDLMVGTFSAE